MIDTGARLSAAVAVSWPEREERCRRPDKEAPGAAIRACSRRTPACQTALVLRPYALVLRRLGGLFGRLPSARGRLGSENCLVDGQHHYYTAGPTDAIHVGQDLVASESPIIVSDHPDLDAGNYARAVDALERWRIWRVEVPTFRPDSFDRDHPHVGFAEQARIVDEVAFEDTFPYWPSLVAFGRKVEAMRQRDVERLARELENVDLRDLQAAVSAEAERLGAVDRVSRAATTIDWLANHAALSENRVRGEGPGVEPLTHWESTPQGGDYLVIGDDRWIAVITYVAILGSTFPIRNDLAAPLRSAAEAPLARSGLE